MENNEILEGGLILDENTISENDYLLWDESNISDFIDKMEADEPKIFYNQAQQHRTRNGCSNYAGFGCISDMMGFRFSLKEILEIHDLAEKKYGWREDYWNYLYKAVDCVRDYWNSKNPDNQVISFRVNLKSKIAQELINKGKTLMIWYKTTKEHYVDSQDNWKMDSDSFANAKKIWWHAIRHNKGNNIDNYIWKKKYNTYENKKLVDYANEGTYFTFGYVFFKKDESNSELAKRLWFWNWKNPNNSATRFEVASMIGALYRKLKK